MTIKEYAEKVAELTGGWVVSVDKANGITLTGVACGKGGVGRIEYMDLHYAKGEDVTDVAKQMNEMDDDVLDIDVKMFNDWEQVKGHLILRLYNQKTKTDVFMSASGYGYDDLIIVPYIDFDKYAVKVGAGMIDMWGVSVETVFETAIGNATADKYSLLSMSNFISGELPDVIMVATSRDCHYGAFAAIALRDMIWWLFPDGYVAIPSSVHEMLILPLSLAEEFELKEIVRSVNHDLVDAQEVLGDKPYFFGVKQ